MTFSQRIFLFLVGLLFFTTTSVAQAQTTDSFTLLPELNTEKFPTEAGCHFFLDDFENEYFFGQSGEVLSLALENLSNDVGFTGDQAFTTEDLLACAVKTGRVKMAYIPYFATYVLSLGTILSGVVAMLFIVIGGYKYTFSGITDDKDSAKKTIQYAIAGLVVSSLAWIIVQVVQTFVSG